MSGVTSLGDNPCVPLFGDFHKYNTTYHKYFLTTIDDFSRFTWIIFLKTKDETRTHLKNFVAYIEYVFRTTLKCLIFDNISEFPMDYLFQYKGITHQIYFVETP